MGVTEEEHPRAVSKHLYLPGGRSSTPVTSAARKPVLKEILTRHPVSVASKKGSSIHFSSMCRFTCIFSASSRPIASASSSSCTRNFGYLTAAGRQAHIM